MPADGPPRQVGLGLGLEQDDETGSVYIAEIIPVRPQRPGFIPRDTETETTPLEAWQGSDPVSVHWGLELERVECDSCARAWSAILSIVDKPQFPTSKLVNRVMLSCCQIPSERVSFLETGKFATGQHRAPWSQC